MPFELTDQHKVAINLALEAVEDTTASIARAKLAGFDVTELEKQLKAKEAQLRSIKQAYFPNG